jgi:hypothetical protein
MTTRQDVSTRLEDDLDTLEPHFAARRVLRCTVNKVSSRAAVPGVRLSEIKARAAKTLPTIEALGSAGGHAGITPAIEQGQKAGIGLDRFVTTPDTRRCHAAHLS